MHAQALQAGALRWQAGKVVKFVVLVICALDLFGIWCFGI